MANRDDRCEGGVHYGCSCSGCTSCDKARARVAELEALLVEIANGPGAGCVGVDKYNQPWATCPCGAEKGYRMSVASLVKHCPQCSHDRPGPGEGD